VFVSDLEGKILHANDAVSQLFGFRQDEVLEQSLSRFITPGEQPRRVAAEGPGAILGGLLNLNMRSLGRIVRLQIQRSTLKTGEKSTRVYDPAPILTVPRLAVGPVVDVHQPGAVGPFAQHAIRANREPRDGEDRGRVVDARGLLPGFEGGALNLEADDAAEGAHIQI